jgi:putative flippase GtrA
MGSKGRVFVAELLRFHVVGACTLLVGTGVFLAMVWAGFGYVIALVGDYAAGIVFSYFMNKKFTFKAQIENDAVPFLVTALTYVVTFMLNILLLTAAVERYGFHTIYSQVVIMLALALVNFLVLKFVVFEMFARRRVCGKTSARER